MRTTKHTAKEFCNIRDSYKTYKANTEIPVKKEVYIEIVNLFMQFLMRKLFTTGLITLPSRLGKLEIVGRKAKPWFDENGEIRGLNIDFRATKELWESDPEAAKKKTKIYFFNEETDGINYKFLWHRNRVLVPNKSYYQLKMSRANKRMLAQLVKNSNVEYRIKN